MDAKGCPKLQYCAQAQHAGAAEGSWEPSYGTGALITCRQVGQASPESQELHMWNKAFVL